SDRAARPTLRFLETHRARAVALGRAGVCSTRSRPRGTSRSHAVRRYTPRGRSSDSFVVASIVISADIEPPDSNDPGQVRASRLLDRPVRCAPVAGPNCSDFEHVYVTRWAQTRPLARLDRPLQRTPSSCPLGD